MDYIVKAYKDWKFHSQFHEIVPEMDDDYMFSEKQSIRESGRSLKKYGSTCCNHIRSPAAATGNEVLIRHDVDKTDTLQGIALKYGCSTEQIRRANRLFASDSLFLRQYLLIPVDKTSPFFPQPQLLQPDENNSSTQQQQQQTAATETSAARVSGVPSVDAAATTAAAAVAMSNNSPRPSVLPTRPYSIAGELLVVQCSAEDSAALNHIHTGVSGNSSSGGKQSKSLDSVAAMTPEEENRKCINDFLSKIDTTISESRKYVEKSSKELITSQSDDDLFVSSDVVQRRRNNQLNNSYKINANANPNHPHHQRHSSSGSTSDTAQLLLNTTQTRRVQNSLKRLEKQQDEFFEL